MLGSMALHLAADRPPVPPADLMLRVGYSFKAPDMKAQRQSFDLEGLEHLRLYQRALAGCGRSFEDFERLLDFGCGCGRFIRHLGSLAERVEIHGTDIDAEMIEWLRQNAPYGSYEVAPHEPPLPYAAQHFDLIINCSVFTHLDERLQDLWLGELQRITRPGAFVLLTVEGLASWNHACEALDQIGQSSARWRSELESRGIVFIPHDGFIGSTHPDFYHSAFHAPWYIFEHWTHFFELAAYLPEGALGHALIVLRRRADAAAQPRPIGHTGSVPASFRGFDIDARAALRRLTAAVRRSRFAGSEKLEGLDPAVVRRELDMLRLGLYEQGNRISVLASQLRDELDEVRRRGQREQNH